MPDEGRIIGFGARTMNNQGPKYINSPDTLIYHKAHELYGIAQAKTCIRKNRLAYLCEGNIDVLAFAELDVNSAVAPLGTSFTYEQAKIIKRRADSIIIVFDADEAGEKATLKAAVTAEKAGLEVQTIRLPRNMDPADFLNQSKVGELKKILSYPVNILNYMLKCRPLRLASDPVKVRLDVLAELKPYLNSVSLEVRRSAYIDYISEQLRLSRESVLAYLEEGEASRLSQVDSSRDIPPEKSFDALEGTVSTDELYLMSAVVLNTIYFARVRKEIIPEMLRDSRALTLYRALEEHSKDGKLPASDEVIMNLEDSILRRFIFEKAAEGVFNREVEKTIDEKIKGLRIRLFIEEHKKLQKQIDNLGSTNEKDKVIPDYMKRIMEINKKIEQITQGKDGRNYNQS